MDLHGLLTPFGIDAPHVEINDLVLDSREVGLNNAFVAVKGHQVDGRDFIPQAISLGAKVILTEVDDRQAHGNVTMREHSIIINVYQLPNLLSEMAQRFFEYRSQDLSLIAITGTNGKTSTAQLTAQLGQRLGIESGTIGTLGAGKVDNLLPLNNTTPDAITMQRLLSSMAADDVSQVAYEASSHALVQGRITNLQTQVAVFTNLSRDHLDYHGSMQQYAAAKLRLREQPGLKFLVVNQQDRVTDSWLKGLNSDITPVQFGFDRAKYPSIRYVVAKTVNYHSNGTSMVLHTSWGNALINSPLLGQFNVLNLMAAISVQLCLGADLNELLKVTPKVNPINGRMELFVADEKPALVVDYAHTPDALEQAIHAARNHTKGQLWLIFGCGGDRDKGKRPLMGEIAERLADRVIITDDNVRHEQPESIVNEILNGFVQPEKAKIEHQRKAAIRYAYQQANADDLILIAGKGHECYQIVGDQQLAYDERAFVAKLLKEGADD